MEKVLEDAEDMAAYEKAIAEYRANPVTYTLDEVERGLEQAVYERLHSPDPELTPSPGGRDCLGNGEHEGIECCCDECSFQMICYPDYRELM